MSFLPPQILERSTGVSAEDGQLGEIGDLLMPESLDNWAYVFFFEQNK